MSTTNAEAVFNKEKVAAEELLFNAQRSQNNTLDGPYGLTVMGTTIGGCLVAFSGYTVGALSFVGTYACFPKDTRIEDQAALLKKDIQTYLVSSPED
jgi:hypothetical protein